MKHAAQPAVGRVVLQAAVPVLLAVTSAKRVAGWDQVPALAEVVPGFEMVGWFGLVAPTGTPPSIISRINDELNKLLSDREVAERILAIGPMVEAGGSPDQFAGFFARRASTLGANLQRNRIAGGVMC